MHVVIRLEAAGSKEAEWLPLSFAEQPGVKEVQKCGDDHGRQPSASLPLSTSDLCHQGTTISSGV